MSEVEVALADLSPTDIQRAAVALKADGLVEATGTFEQRVSDLRNVAGRARQLIGTWPNAETGADRLIAALEALASRGPDEPTRSRASGALAQVGGFSRDTIASIAATVITGQLPGAAS